MIAVHFGAGNIGRGLIGNILNNNNYDIYFVDTNNQLIEQINYKNEYSVEYFDNEKPVTQISNVTAINSITESDKVIKLIQKADILTTSVGVNNLEKIAPIIKQGLLERVNTNKPLNILANENTIHASSILKDEIYKVSTYEEVKTFNKICYFANTTIDRQSLSKTINGESIALVEPYYEWVIDKTEMSEFSELFSKDVTLVDSLKPYIERKLFIVNAEHAAFAYLGELFGFSTIQEAAKNKRIYQLVSDYLQENKLYFIKKYEMNKNDIDHFIQKTIKRHTQNEIEDSIYRVGRDPIRKLNKDDRIVGPVIKLENMNLENKIGKKIIVSAYLYENQDDPEAVTIQKSIQKNGIAYTIQKFSGVNGSLLKDLVNIYDEIKNDKEKIFKDLGRYS